MDRRRFVTAVSAGAVLAPARVLGANDRIRIGLIGTGGRCMSLAGMTKGLANTEMVAACDVYEPRRLEACEKMGTPCSPVADYRALLDRKDIDAVIIGSPDHWHAPMTLDAVAAGKDVYLEKPVTHRLEEGEKLIAGVEKSGRVVATGTQQRSWDHFILAKQMIDSGRLGQITLAQCYWFQNYTRRARPDAEIDASKLDWKAWLGTAREQPFDVTRYRRWRFFWDFGGGIFTDLMTHWIDVIQWYMKSPSPKTVTAAGSTHAISWFECPDTVNASIQFPNNYSAVYYGTMIGSLEDGGIIFRGTGGMMKLTREGFAIWNESLSARAEFLGLPNPDVIVKSTGDGTRTNLQNWLDCMRSRALPNAHIRAGVEAARTSHLANQAMRQQKVLSVS